jgi:hypothetical protein
MFVIFFHHLCPTLNLYVYLLMLCEVPACLTCHSVQQIKQNTKSMKNIQCFYVPVFNLDLFISEEPGSSWAWLAAILDIPAENRGQNENSEVWRLMTYICCWAKNSRQKGGCWWAVGGLYSVTHTHLRSSWFWFFLSAPQTIYQYIVAHIGEKCWPGFKG